MRIYDTANLDEKALKSFSPDDASWIYNGLDVCVTAEIYTELSAQLAEDEPCVQATYAFALEKLAPIMEMNLRGTKIDKRFRDQSLAYLEKSLQELDEKFQRICQGVFDCPVNFRSHVQVKNLFYGMLQLKEFKARNSKGIWAPAVNEEALNSLNKYVIARPLVNLILLMRNLDKQASFLRTEIDADSRMRTSYNIAGTDTGRLSSRMSDFGTGTNLQNVNRSLRQPFVADAGMYMLNIDLEQADARNLGAICVDFFHETHPEEAAKFLDACESGDLHTLVCRLNWPDLPWPDDPAEHKNFCDTLILYGQDTFRQGAKKLGHGTNYYGTPRTMAKHTHVATTIIEDFQKKYFVSFPVIRMWHNKVIEEIKTKGTLYTLFGRRRMFFDRGTEASTHRKAIAYAPQSMTGEQIDRALHAIWLKYPNIELLNQVHDSILLQLPFADAEDLVAPILKTMEIKLLLPNGREFFVPLDAAGGWNWGYYDKETNKYGLIKWQGKEARNPPIYRTPAPNSQRSRGKIGSLASRRI